MQYLLWFRQMSIQIKFRANFLPIGEASFLDSWHMADQIWAMLSDVISEWEVDFFRDESELWQHSKRDNIQLFRENKNVISFKKNDNDNDLHEVCGMKRLYLHWLVHRRSRMVCQLRCRTRLSDRVCQILRFLPVCAHQFLVLSLSYSPATTEHETTISRNYVTRGGWHTTQERMRERGRERKREIERKFES